MKKINLDFYIKFLIYSLPIMIIIGNFALNSAMILCIFFFLLKKKIYNIYLYFKNILKYLFFIIILFLINIFSSSFPLVSASSFLGVIKSALMILIMINIFVYEDKFHENLSKFILLVFFIVSLDTILQYFYGQNILGYKTSISHGHRLSSFFGSEQILGSYFAKFIFLAILFLDQKKYKYIQILIVVYFFTLIILTNERAASINMLLATSFFLIFNPNFNYKQKIIMILICISLILSFFYLDKNLKKHFIDRTFQQIGITKNNPGIKHNSFWDSQWGAHFLTSYEIFKDYPILGSGLHTFRHVCSNKRYETIKSAEVKVRCNTHPHNFYLEILSELGLVFFTIFLIFHIYLFFLLIKKFANNKQNRFQILCLICSFFILFNPIQTTGAYFSSTNGFFYILNYSYFIYYIFFYKNFTHSKT